MTSDAASDRRLALDLLGGASHRLIRTVDGLHGDDWAAPSLLPEWSRAHVVAHLALNAEGLARALRGVVSDDDTGPRTMYDSDERRDSDIVDLARAEPSEIRERLLGGTTSLHDAIAAVPEDCWDSRVERTPGGRSLPTTALPSMRLREVEIHHVDLDAGYSTAAWSLPFAEHLLDSMDKRVHPDHAFEVRPLDSARTWLFGSDEAEYPVPVVTGPAADLGLWLTGRPAPESVSCSHGELPSIEGW
jgi:maleylpyruvate isomerase